MYESTSFFLLKSVKFVDNSFKKLSIYLICAIMDIENG